MATLNIRNLPDPVHARLRLRAARLGRSMEAEAREILSSACRPAADDEQLLALPDLVDNLYGKNKPRHVVDDLIADRRHDAEQERRISAITADRAWVTLDVDVSISLIR